MLWSDSCFCFRIFSSAFCSKYLVKYDSSLCLVAVTVGAIGVAGIVLTYLIDVQRKLLFFAFRSLLLKMIVDEFQLLKNHSRGVQARMIQQRVNERAQTEIHF